MNTKQKEEIRAKIKVLEAFLEGKVIEWKHSHLDLGWDVADTPVWDFAKYEYRVKPSPKVVFITSVRTMGELAGITRVVADSYAASPASAMSMPTKYIELTDEVKDALEGIL